MLIRMRNGRRPGVGQIADWVFLVPIFTGLVFWFFTAPDVRFANALIWLLAAASTLMLICTTDRYRSRSGASVPIIASALACNASLVFWAANYVRILREVSTAGWEPVMQASFMPRRTFSGLIVYTYTYGAHGLIWDGPIPATPEFNPRLALRVPGKPEFGFYLR